MFVKSFYEFGSSVKITEEESRTAKLLGLRYRTKHEFQKAPTKDTVAVIINFQIENRPPCELVLGLESMNEMKKWI